jgi:deoxycytidylate deaminase
LAVGYNGDESGGSNVPECLSPGESGWVHAEENALLKLGNICDGVMFITDSPCEMCAKKIINSAKIKEVYYLREYRDLTGVGRLIAAGINTYKYIFLNSKGDQVSDNAAFDMLKPGGLTFL